MDDFADVDDILDEVEAAEKELDEEATVCKQEFDVFPFDSAGSNGLSSLRIVDLAHNLSVGWTLGYRLFDSLYYKTCDCDTQKLYRSAAFLRRGEEFALKVGGYNKAHPPLYLRYYQNDTTETQTDSTSTNSLLNQSIDELFSNMVANIEQISVEQNHQPFQFLRKRRRNTVHNGFNESWLIKYQPQYFSDLLTEEKVNVEVLQWLLEWKCCHLQVAKKMSQPCVTGPSHRLGTRKHNDIPKDVTERKRILLLGGPAGVGKSTVVNILARHCGFDVVEINASEDRSKAKIMPTIKGIITANAISRERPNLCLLEEIDGLHAGEGQIIVALKELNQKNMIKRPIVCICNDLYNKNLRELRQIAKVIVVDTCDTEALKHRLMYIAECEGYRVDENVIDDLMKLHHNDVRSCITALEFIIRNPGLASNLDIFTKDRYLDLLVFLKDLFNTKNTTKDLNDASTTVVAALGTQTTCHLILENVTKIGLKHHFNTTVLYDLLAQGDVIHNASWIQVLINFVRCMRLKSGSRFLLPGALHSHYANIRIGKNYSVLKSLRTHATTCCSTLSSSLGAQIMPALCLMATSQKYGSISRVNVARTIKDVDFLLEAFGPLKLASINRLFRLSVLLQVYGITVIEVQEKLVFDPPILEFACDYNTPLETELYRMIYDITKVSSSHMSDYKPRNLHVYVHDLTQLGFISFMRKYRPQTAPEELHEHALLCRTTTKDVVPITFSHLLEREIENLSHTIAAYDIEPSIRTNGVYRFHGEQCGAVRYLINDI